MNKNIILVTLGLAASANCIAQTKISKSIPLQAGQTITMRFDYPELIRISTWDKNEISIEGTVTINGGENDDAFELKIDANGKTVSVSNEIRDMKNLPHRITISDGAQKTVFRNKEELKKYEAEHGKIHNQISYGLDMEILINIKVPRNISTNIESVYGMVEVKNFTGPLTVDATYGGVDAALSEKNAGEIIAETNYGEIYSNLETHLKGEQSRNEDFHTYVASKPGDGPRYDFESKYGNVYLRKEN